MTMLIRILLCLMLALLWPFFEMDSGSAFDFSFSELLAVLIKVVLALIVLVLFYLGFAGFF